jgi:hypothetical protein
LKRRSSIRYLQKKNQKFAADIVNKTMTTQVKLMYSLALRMRAGKRKHYLTSKSNKVASTFHIRRYINTKSNTTQ